MVEKKDIPEMEFFTTTALAQMSGLTPDYIRQLILSDKIKAKKIGRDWAISATEVMRFLEEREQE